MHTTSARSRMAVTELPMRRRTHLSSPTAAAAELPLGALPMWHPLPTALRRTGTPHVHPHPGLRVTRNHLKNEWWDEWLLKQRRGTDRRAVGSVRAADSRSAPP